MNYGYPKCSQYIGKNRCENDSVYHVLAPDGSYVPGAWVCKEHGEAIIKEYKEKLGEIWSLHELYGART